MLDLEVKDAQLIFQSVWQNLESEMYGDNMHFPAEIFWLNGAPGAGKGTQAAFIMEFRDFTEKPIVVSDLLKSPEARKMMDAGVLAGDREVTEPMLDILFDEKIAGSFHFTPGQAYEEADNGNQSQVHWDMVCIQRPDCGGGEILFDGELIRKEGQFVPDDLQQLNPEHLLAESS